MMKKKVFGKKIWGICIALALMIACVWTAVVASSNKERDWLDEGPRIEDYDYSFAVVGDTQVVNIKYHDKLVNIYDYICENVVSKNMKYVFSVGDITDTNVDKEWSEAYNQIHRMDSLVPYNVLRGNHDGSVQMNRYFPYSDFENMCGGSYDGKIENTWQTLAVGNLDYLIVSLDYGPSDDVLAWASDVIEQHPYHNVIVVTHGYLYSDGTLLDQNDGESSAPATSGGYNNGDHIWDKLISNEPFNPTYEWVNEHVSEEQVIMNMINSFLGRMHLASHLELLNEEKKSLIKEGVEYFNQLSRIKNKALPFIPKGFCNFGDTLVASGLKYENKVYLAVWNLGEVGEKEIELCVDIQQLEVAYPRNSCLTYDAEGSKLKIDFTEEYQARFFEIVLSDR